MSAICLAPVTLANAGLLEGKRATVYPSAKSFLKWKGATYTGNPVEVDGNIVTANGPEVAEEFAQAVAGMVAITGRDGKKKYEPDVSKILSQEKLYQYFISSKVDSLQ